MGKELAFKKNEVAGESRYKYELSDIAKKFLPIEKERLIYKTMKKIFNMDPMSTVDPKMYHRGGFRQLNSKKQFAELGKQIAKERGIPSYSRAVGIPLGQRALEPYLISGTDTIVDYDDLHHVNNAAIQQMLDDIKRTVILNLDLPHQVLQVRAGKEITPETVNLYLETTQHTIAGGAVAQEHMAEINPGLTKDAYVKVITGSDEVKDNLDRRFLIDIDKLFHPTRAEALKNAIGNTMFLVARVPTITVRMGDGGVVYRWAAMQSSMAFISAYRLTGESIISDIAFAAKSAQCIVMGERTWYSRARSQNEPGGIPFGYIADIVQCFANLPSGRLFTDIIIDDLEEGRKYLHAMAEGLGTVGSILTELLWYGFYMSGGLGFSTGVAAGGYCGNVVEDFVDSLSELIHKYMKGIRRVPPKWDTVRWIIDTAIQIMMETYEKYPSLMEFHWGGAHRISLIGGLAGNVASMLTGSPILGLTGINYTIAMLMKEGWLRTGWAGQEVQDHVGLAYSMALRMEEGGVPELRGTNYPVASYTAGHSASYIGACMTSAMARGDAFVCSPQIKVAFADPHLIFDFRNPRLSIAKACLKEFKPAGERNLIIPY
ncbi:MAG: coenzyme-B sulfoethylthiotransferase subunit alpha [Candidatus Helarchaeota archaeon]